MTSKRPKTHPSTKLSADTDPPSRPNSSAPDDRSPYKNPNPSKNPNPNSSKKPKSSHPMAKDPDAAAPSSSPRKRQGKRKSREFPDEEASPATAVDNHGGGKGSQSSLRPWTDDAALAVLKGVIEFRSRTGSTPTASTVGAFFDSIKASLPPQITQEQVYNKLRHLRHKYNQAAAGGLPDSPFYRLSVEAWEAEGKKANGGASDDNNWEVVAKDEDGGAPEGDDGPASYSLLTNEIDELLKKNGWEEKILEKVSKLIDPEKAKAMEGKLWQHYDAELKLEVKRHELAKEVFKVLGAAAHRGTSS